MSPADFLNLAMVACLIGALMLGFPVAFTIPGIALIFGLLGTAFGAFDVSFLKALSARMDAVIEPGSGQSELLLAVPMFVFMGVMLERSRVAEDMLEAMGRLFGARPGGLGLSVILVGMLMAASTGIVGATVVTMTLLSLPVMLKNGYDPKLATGTIAAAGTLGQVIPPSIVLVLLGQQLSATYQNARMELGDFAPDPVSVADLFAGALLPGLVLVVFFLLFQIAIAMFRPTAAPAVSFNEPGSRSMAGLISLLAPPLVLIVAVLGSILAGVATPTEAASIGAAGAILLAGYRQTREHGLLVIGAGLSVPAMLIASALFDVRISKSAYAATDWAGIALCGALGLILCAGMAVSLIRLWRGGILSGVVNTTLEITAMVFLILFGAMVFTLVFRGLGGEAAVHHLLTNMPGGAPGAMVVVMLTMFILGFVLDFIEIVFIVVPIVSAILFRMDIYPFSNPVWLGVMFAINLQTSFLTPPFGFALFYLRGSAPPEVMTSDIYRGVIPFVVLQIVMLFVLFAFPELAIWLPKALFG